MLQPLQVISALKFSIISLSVRMATDEAMWNVCIDQGALALKDAIPTQLIHYIHLSSRFLLRLA